MDSGGGGIALAKAARRLRRFAEFETAGVSPLYEHLASQASGDDEVADLLTAADDRYATATLFFAAAHRLVLAEPICELANYYPSVGGSYGVDGRTWPVFREFVLARADRMRELIATRTTQTNEVRRAAALYPAVAVAAKRAVEPVGLLEVGCSAGLLLGLDLYRYRYTRDDGTEVEVGPAKAPLQLECALELAEQSGTPPKLPKRLRVAAKVGLDRAPVDLTDEQSYAWLEACIWPDHPERMRRFSLAASLQRKQPPMLVSGDLVDDLAAAASRVPHELPLVVVTSHVMQYVDRDRRREFVSALARLSRDRRLWWVSKDIYQAALALLTGGRDDLMSTEEDPTEVLGLVQWESGEPSVRAMARTAAHGQRIRWLPGTTSAG